MNRIFNFTIPGPPRTKKTHSRIITRRGTVRRQSPLLLPSEQFIEWNQAAQMHLARIRAASLVPLPIRELVNVRALFYREALTGDAVGYYQALADALEDGRILENDKQCISWDGSRLLKDAENPRIEITLEVPERTL